MDTASDFRILLAEKGLNELEKLIQSIKIQQRKAFLNELKSMQSWIQVVKYSYLSPADILNLDEMRNLVKKSGEVSEALRGVERDFKSKCAVYWLEYINKLPSLMERGEISKAYEAIRYFSGEIVNRVKLKKLWLCSVDCNFRVDVVTNSEEFKPGMFVVVSYLPPQVLEGKISEGMFVDASLNKKGELNHQEIKNVSDKLGEVESILLEIVK